MKKIFIISCMVVLSCAAFGQQIKNKNVELDDLLTLLQASGYELFNFDITEMLNEQYNIEITSKEYVKGGEEITSKNFASTSNKRLMTDFPESQWQKIIDDGRIIDTETKAIAHAEKIAIGLYPSGNDTTVRLQINIPNFTGMGTSYNLRGLPVKDSDKKFYRYYTRPFKIEAFKEDAFIPLILYGSMWYDERFGVFRFCGEKEIDPDMSSEILKDVPHYYVLGVKFVRKQPQVTTN